VSFLQNLTDDQTALLGCFVALLASGTLMSLSYYLGQVSRPRRTLSPAAGRASAGEKSAGRQAA
jgi:hypothetical protein